MKTSEKDWKLFRSLLPKWQEKYMGQLCDKYLDILNSEEINSERFWALYKQINKDVNSSGVKLSLSRSYMSNSILMLLRDGVITLDDLKDFSDEVKEYINVIIKINDYEKERKR